MARGVLLVGTTPAFQGRMAGAMKSQGIDLVCVRTDLEAIARFRQLRPDIVLLDLDSRIPVPTLIQELHAIDKAAQIVGLTDGAAAVQTAALARVLRKPVREDEIVELIRSLRADDGAPDHPEEDGPALEGSSPGFKAVLSLIESAAKSDAPVLLVGESGTGKSLAARRIHELSSHAQQPLTVVNCLCESAAEQVNRAFDQASSADGGAGTLVLDNICDLSHSAQTVLLSRIKETGRSAAPRLLTTSYRTMEQLVGRTSIRRDLVYRLAEITIHLPPLRERDGDVIEIARTFLKNLARAGKGPEMRISPEVEELLLSHDWPGNVRELCNMLRTATLGEQGDCITLDMLPDYFRRLIRTPKDSGAPTAEAWRGRTLAEIERYVIEQSLLAAGGSVPRAARNLDVSPSTIYRKLESWARQDAADRTR